MIAARAFALVAASAVIFVNLVGTTPAVAAVVEATRPLSRGMIIEPGDAVVTSEEARRGEAETLEEVVGMEVRRSIYRGRAIRLTDLRKPTLVHRNDLVEIVYRQGTLSIRGEGRSMRDGGHGDRVRVMNLDSRTIITGRVSAAGQVEVSR